MKRQQSGFTLIELVIVVVILGILAAVALPRFVNFTSSARQGVLSGIAAAVASTNTMVYAQAAIQGNLSGSDANTLIPGVDVNGSGGADAGDTVVTRYGYLRSANATDRDNLAALLQLESNSASGGAGLSYQVSGGEIHIGYDPDNDGNVLEDDCHITYEDSTAVGVVPAAIEFVTDDC